MAAAAPASSKLLTEEEAGDPRLVVQQLQQPGDETDKKLAGQLLRQGQQQSQRRNWSAAVKLLGESMIRHPTPEALAGYADAEIRMLAQARAHERDLDERIQGDMRHAVRFYESSLAADSVLKTLGPQKRFQVERNVACLQAFLRTGDKGKPCEPLHWYLPRR
ncbi:hypothetical protein [Paracidovorax anthurii]|nr:hypothetical protein [Paracidovorax anthurii]